MSSQYYIILTQRQITSNYNGNKIAEITLVGVQDRCLYKTYVDPQNRNFKNWSYIIHNPAQGYLVSGIRIKDQDKALISADSQVKILVATEEASEVYSELLAKWHREDDVGVFDALFD